MHTTLSIIYKLLVGNLFIHRYFCPLYPTPPSCSSHLSFRRSTQGAAMPTLRTTMLPTRHPTNPRAGSSDAPNHAAEHGQHATDLVYHAVEPAGSAAATERQAWRIPEDQAADFFALYGTHGCR
jgi:hypothetical protein